MKNSTRITTIGLTGDVNDSCPVQSVNDHNNKYVARSQGFVPQAPYNVNLSGLSESKTATLIGMQVSQGFNNDYRDDANAYCYGLHLRMTTAANNNTWNIYASGGAPNYFAGSTRIEGTVTFSNSENGLSEKGYQYQTNGHNRMSRPTGDGTINPCLTLTRTHATSGGTWITLTNSNHDGTATSSMTCGGNLSRTIDARLSPTATPLADGATDIVKLLQPKVITQQGHTFKGFLPDDLTPVFNDAVIGEAGATVAIGTYTDPEGVVETEVEEPEAIPYGATWQQTGIRDVMQGVCREELIPLLTKALQEALTEIDSLKSRVDTLEGN